MVRNRFSRKARRVAGALVVVSAFGFTAGLSTPLVNQGLHAEMTDTSGSLSTGTVGAGSTGAGSVTSPALTATRLSGGDCQIGWSAGSTATWLNLVNKSIASGLYNGAISMVAGSVNEPFYTPRAISYSGQGSNAKSADDAANLSDNWLGALSTATCPAWAIADDFNNSDNLTSTGGALWNLIDNMTVTGGAAKGIGKALINFADANVSESANIGGDGSSIIIRSDATGKNYTRLRMTSSTSNYTASWTERTTTTTRTTQPSTPVPWSQCGSKTQTLVNQTYQANYAGTGWWTGYMNGSYVSGPTSDSAAYSGPAKVAKCYDSYSAYLSDSYSSSAILKYTVRAWPKEKNTGLCRNIAGDAATDANCYRYTTNEWSVNIIPQIQYISTPDIINTSSSDSTRTGTRTQTNYTVYFETVADGSVTSSRSVFNAVYSQQSQDYPLYSNEYGCSSGSYTSGSTTYSTSCSIYAGATRTQQSPPSTFGLQAAANNVIALVNGSQVYSATNTDTNNTYHGVESTTTGANVDNYALNIK